VLAPHLLRHPSPLAGRGYWTVRGTTPLSTSTRWCCRTGSPRGRSRVSCRRQLQGSLQGHQTLTAGTRRRCSYGQAGGAAASAQGLCRPWPQRWHPGRASCPPTSQAAPAERAGCSVRPDRGPASHPTQGMICPPQPPIWLILPPPSIGSAGGSLAKRLIDVYFTLFRMILDGKIGTAAQVGGHMRGW
jgi:hypothetical protein